MDRLKIGIIGCGKQARKHVDGLRDGDVELVLSDVNMSHARKLAEDKGISECATVNDIMTDPSVNAVDICTPTNTHFPLVEMALSNGKDVFCEKPLSNNLAETRSMAEAARAAGRVGMVGFIYRFAPVFEAVHKLLIGVSDEGISEKIGRVVAAHFRIGGRGDHQAWKHQRDTAGGAINEMLVHMIDLAIWLFGHVDSVEVLQCDLLRPERRIGGELIQVDAEDYILVLLTVRSGLKLLIQADMVTPAFTQFMEVQGENFSLMASIQKEIPSYLFLKEDAEDLRAGRNNLDAGANNLFGAQMKEFLNAIGGGQGLTRSTFDDSVNVMSVIESVREEAMRLRSR